jgi:hypothetical protein
MNRAQRPLRVLTIALGAFGAAWAWSGAASAQPTANTGTWIVDTRLRYEEVSQSGLEDADAITVRATVPDPEVVELYRVQLAGTGEEGRRAIVGRQRIVLNDARFADRNKRWVSLEYKL